MEKVSYIVPKDLEPYINCVMIGSNSAKGSQTNIPIYADGYPGIMFQQSENGFYLLPKGKELSELFLYGQTLDPISLDTKGPYRYVVFQLYPFASRHLLGIDPKILNDDCFDLLQLDHVDVKALHQKMLETNTLEGLVELVSDLMQQLIKANQISTDDSVQQAIALIIEHQGKLSIKDVRDQVFISERTFERKFKAETGLSPKQFAKIIQFQSAMHQLSEASYTKLIDIGLDSGFSDQPHFIRTFKGYTGQTPSYFLKHQAAS